MLALIYAYLVAPRGFRRVLRLLALCFVVVVLAMVIVLFYRVLSTLPEHHGWILHPRSHQPMSPDFIRYDLSQQYRPAQEDL